MACDWLVPKVLLVVVVGAGGDDLCGRWWGGRGTEWCGPGDMFDYEKGMFVARLGCGMVRDGMGCGSLLMGIEMGDGRGFYRLQGSMETLMNSMAWHFSFARGT